MLFLSDVFEDLLGDAARRTASLSQLNLQFSKYDSVLGELPTEQDLLDTDALLVTGSCQCTMDQLRVHSRSRTDV
jgi:hypothetical protein